MNKKTRIISILTMFIVIALLSTPLVFGQFLSSYDYCKVSAYGNSLLEFEGTSNAYRYEFTVVVPPSGSEITNTIEVMDNDSGENYTINLSAGQIVRVNYADVIYINNTVEPAAEAYHYIIYYEGAVTRLLINSIDVPEFPPILIVPLFMTATLLALVYRRKKTT